MFNYAVLLIKFGVSSLAAVRAARLAPYPHFWDAQSAVGWKTFTAEPSLGSKETAEAGLPDHPLWILHFHLDFPFKKRDANLMEAIDSHFK
ncbi:hypothetical protein HJG54_21020 [Leptolyngbya sp. NK1-12]|uniref:Uncharacterized protein n=1 Tax=Leptolyngbya sp. NK1-12 TaxID=2547451 RepID=A0AA96WH00_9CYAN|nr:hypothetical protein [Leptolyngbya sp. NK1-12]WNZ25084.1 hypothetical protein HJG54_21020 [Leptolyngbya sp. NK1-12]